MIDALTVRALGAELQGTIAGGRVQNLYFLAPQVIGLEVYATHKRHYVLASAEPQHARLLLVTEKLRSASVPLTPFFLLLKKYLMGAFVNRVQVVTRERILRIEFDHHEQGISTLVAELMGNRTNLILLDAGGNILDAIRRIPPADNRARAIVPRTKYFPPPPQAKTDPLKLTAAQLESLLENARGETLAERLVASLAGTSPLLGREIAFRVSGASDAPYDPACVTKTLEQLTRFWVGPAEPSLALDGERIVEVAAFALKQYPQAMDIPSMSAALERFFGVEESYEAVKEPLRAQIQATLDKMERTLASLNRELIGADEIETLKLKGEMILGYQYELTEGQTRLHAPVSDELVLDITLDPDLSPVENANRYFDEYKRARDARERVPERIANVENDIQYARQVSNDLDLAESRVEIDQALEQAREANLIRMTPLRAGGRAPRSEPRQYLSPDNLYVLVGRNARQNDALTFERSKPDDLWLHARGYAGSHVVILSNGADVPARTLEFAAALAAYYSQARAGGAVDVIYTPRKNVHRVRGAGAHPGLVTVKEERVLRVRPNSPEG